VTAPRTPSSGAMEAATAFIFEHEALPDADLAVRFTAEELAVVLESYAEERVREAYERAARAVCPFCEYGDEASGPDDAGDYWHAIHRRMIPPDDERCEASAIRALAKGGK
jgi:hypothetical protein